MVFRPHYRQRVKAELHPIPELLTRSEAAAKARISVRTLDRLRDTGEIETQPVGARRMVVAHSLGSYLERQREAVHAESVSVSATREAMFALHLEDFEAAA